VITGWGKLYINFFFETGNLFIKKIKKIKKF